MVNSVDPAQLASQKQADLDLHCFQDSIFPSLACMVTVKVDVQKLAYTEAAHVVP